MGDKFEKLTEKHIQFISEQHLFFVGTAAAEGFVNVSPKGLQPVADYDIISIKVA